MLCLQHSDCSTASDSSIINTRKMTLGMWWAAGDRNCAASLCRGLSWHQSPGCRAVASPPTSCCSPRRPRPKLKPNKGLKPTKGLACLLLTPVQLWSLLWLYGRLVPKPGQELPAPYRYLGLHPMGGLSGEMSLPSCPILARISVQPQSRALCGLLWVPEVSSEWCLLWRYLRVMWMKCQGLCFLKIPKPHNWSYMMMSSGMSKQPGALDFSPSTHLTSSEGPPGKGWAQPWDSLSTTDLRGGWERVPGLPLTYLVAWPDLLRVRFTVLMNAHLCFNYRGCWEREEPNWAQSQVKRQIYCLQSLQQGVPRKQQ